MTNQIQPIFILPESKSRETGKGAQRTNITAARLVADTVRTTLGPKGMDKMLVSNSSITITNDGVTILKEMNIEHPSAKMIVEIAKSQEKEAGDGTTTAVVIAGELLKKAEELLEMNIHPTVLAKGYRLAADKAIEILDKIGEKVTENDKKTLRKVAMTAMTGKSAEVAKEELAKIAIEAVLSIAEKEDGFNVDKNNIKIEKRVGASIEQSELVHGIILDKERVHADMPRVVDSAKILLVDTAIEIKDTETKAKIKIRNPMQIQSFIEQEEKMLKDMVEKISKSRANVLLCQKGIDDRAQHFLAKKGIYAVRRVKRSDMEALARATGATIITNFDEINKKDLGNAGRVEELKIGDEEMTVIKDCRNAKSVTILLRGATEHVLDELKRALEDAVGVVSSVILGSKIVGGAGSVEIEVARQLRKYTDSLSGREQLAAKAFADAIEIIPTSLAENAGLDAVDIITELKAAHDKGKKWEGVNVFSGKAMDAWKEGILEPLKVKSHAISSAAEVAIMILRIDDIIVSSKPSETEQKMARTGMHGMGGYGM